MQIQELINSAYKKATGSSEPLRESALTFFNTQELKRYTELIIQHTCEQAVKLEGKNLND